MKTISKQQLPDILDRESGNRRYIYLYPRHRGKAWVAYEKSAHNLHRLLPHICLFCCKAEGMSNRKIITLVVPQLSLEFLIEKGVDICDYDDGRNLRLTMPACFLSNMSQRLVTIS